MYSGRETANYGTYGDGNYGDENYGSKKSRNRLFRRSKSMSNISNSSARSNNSNNSNNNNNNASFRKKNIAFEISNNPPDSSDSRLRYSRYGTPGARSNPDTPDSSSSVLRYSRYQSTGNNTYEAAPSTSNSRLSNKRYSVSGESYGRYASPTQSETRSRKSNYSVRPSSGPPSNRTISPSPSSQTYTGSTRGISPSPSTRTYNGSTREGQSPAPSLTNSNKSVSRSRKSPAPSVRTYNGSTRGSSPSPSTRTYNGSTRGGPSPSPSTKTYSNAISVKSTPRNSSKRSVSPARSTKSRSRSAISGISRTSSTSTFSKTSDIILRKVFRDGKWYEEKVETKYTKKEDGKIGKRAKVKQSEINVDEEGPDISESLSDIDPNFLDVDRATQHLSRNSRGLIQDDQEDFGRALLSRINYYRMEHNARSVKLNPNLSVYAREWAKYLANKSKVGFCNRHDIGEAIYAKTSSVPYDKVSGDDLVDKWYSEIEMHDFQNKKEIKASNFCQLVWRSTKDIGVTLERSPDGLVSYVVVFFHPKGLFPGTLTKQVYPVGGPTRIQKNEKGIAEPQAVEMEEGFLPAVLRACNYYRLIHNVTPFALDKALTAYAQEWATQLASEDKVRSRSNNVYGENIYRSSFKLNSDLHGQEPVEYWYRTKKYYTLSDPPDPRAAPFTQLVWSDTREIGVGRSKSKSDRTYVVVNFNPPGNLIGHFQKQVPHVKWHK